ncbi:MAG: alpha/beta hydrolase family protein [Abditibacteriales bacterium]|nr:alpha/beta hydrolase family protein [Abditibacteriales bacterium]MDW8367069.1 alpha/beta hydrolase family protein [Abditibacteriales bacterium]
MTTRREFLQSAAASLGCALVVSGESAVPTSPRQVGQAGSLRDAAPLTTAEKGASMPMTNADVGSLFPFIRSQAVQADFPLSFLREEFKDVAAWKRVARGKLLELLHYAPPPCDPQPEVVERMDKGDYVREKVYFNTTPDIRVPAYVLIPKNVRFPAPGIVALHDHGGFYFWGKEKIVEVEDEHPVLTDFKKRYYAGNSIASVLARQGYVVVVIDMFYWGERRMLLDGDPTDWRERPQDIAPERIAAFNQRASQNEPLVGRTIYAAGFTWSGVMFWDDVRTVDYLLTRPEVDKNRLGCVGLSVGGLRSCHLAALDDRIKAAVVVGWMASFPKQLQRHIRNTIGHTKLVPGLYRYMDYPDVAALAMPAALLVINGSQDQLFALDGVQDCFDKLAACYKKAGVPDKLRTRLYDTPHEFNAAMQAEAWEWLRRWLT